ncbi:MAG: hypothetical protein Q9164_006054 [Protoblastenia rupestris]
MVVEALPDYYGDLDLKPGADPNDVKKQYRKLALKYHPDRNPGHEAEYAIKFQAIQSAHEVLTDPAQRAKYDAQRLRHGLLSAYASPPPRPNVPPRTQTTNFPPPPRPPPPSASKPSYSPPRPGASKYARFTGASSRWGTAGTDDAKSKTNDFKAWEQMRHGQGPIPPRRAPPPKAPRATHFETERTSSPGRSQPKTTANGVPLRRGAWEDLRDAGMPNLSRANTTRAPPKKAGFAPSPPARHEPPARSAYFNTFKGERPPPKPPSSSMPPPPPRVPTSKKPDPQGADFEFPLGTNHDRVSTPYHSPGGEKTFLSSPGLHRSSTSTTPRESNSRTGWHDRDSLHPDGEHIRAASAGAANRDGHRTMPGVSSATTTDTSSSSDEAEAETLYTGPRGTRVQASRKTRMPAGAGVRPRSSFPPHVRVEDVEDEPEASHTFLNTGFRKYSGVDMPSQKPFSDQPEDFMSHRMKQDAPQLGSQSAIPPAAYIPTEHSIPRRKSFDEKYRSTPDSKSSDHTSNNHKNKTPILFGPPSLRAETDGKSDSQPSFRLSTDDLERPFVGKPPLRSQSSETINVKFSPSCDPPRFGGDNAFFSSSSPDHSNKSSTLPAGSRSSQAPRHNERAGEESPGLTSSVPPPPKGPSKYLSEDWDKRFGAHTFQPPPSGSASGTASRKRSGTPRTGSLNNLKRAGTFSRATGFQPTVVDAQDEPPVYNATPAVSVNSSKTSSRVSTGSDGSAMDIDSTPPPVTDHNSTGNGDSGFSTRKNDFPSKTDVPILPPRADNPLQSEGDSINMNLGGFKNVAPFAPSNEGLNDTDDLKGALPFESRASTTIPNFDECTKKIEFPKVPKTPSPPSTLTQTSWNRYLTDMNAYIFKWNTFSANILLLFHKRQEEHREIGPSWVSCVGGDCDLYLKALDEDERARKYWEVASERHRECFRDLKRVREEMLRSQGHR